jgi:hypothetical protein
MTITFVPSVLGQFSGAYGRIFERSFEDEQDRFEAEYCVLSHKYPELVSVKDGDKVVEMRLKELVNNVAAHGMDLAATAYAKCKMSKCNENGRVRTTVNMVVMKMIITGKLPKASKVQESPAGLEWSEAEVREAGDISEMGIMTSPSIIARVSLRTKYRAST